MGTFQMWLLHARKGSLYQVRNISDISASLYIPILLGYWQPLTESCTTHARKKSLLSFVYSIPHILTTKMMYHNKDQTQKRKESHEEYIVYKDIYVYKWFQRSSLSMKM